VALELTTLHALYPLERSATTNQAHESTTVDARARCALERTMSLILTVHALLFALAIAASVFDALNNKRKISANRDILARRGGTTRRRRRCTR
jgi:hypothetical protein